ncbi:hypothetical protein JOE31_003686 [Arthrobacter sp. PvP023]|uniref:DUF6318 family protein n=1 Tax=Micrococcaceae TaxID=1268 RepID=UPI001AE26BE7|nr:DUF6318 family protein [Arthrobacter sp. PvP023]MBP1137454.1 hypothetical protein [Arthrobacter sp. PvP023]
MTSRTSPFARLRYSAAAVVAASALMLTACNGGATPPGNGSTSASASASESATATPSPTPTPTAAYKPADAKGKAQNVPVPVLPEAAKAETKEGLEAFAKYWYQTLSYAYETGDVTPLQAVSTTTCTSCLRVKEVVEAWHSEGRWLAGGKMVVQGVQSKFVETAPGEYQVLIQVFQEPLSYYRSDKTLDEKTEQKPAAGDIMLASYEGGAWRAKTVEHLANSQ